MDELVLLCVLALLICNTAAGLASRLAGSLAFAATAVLGAVTQVTSLNGLNVLHDDYLHKRFFKIVPLIWFEVNTLSLSTRKNSVPFALGPSRGDQKFQFFNDALIFEPKCSAISHCVFPTLIIA